MKQEVNRERFLASSRTLIEGLGRAHRQWVSDLGTPEFTDWLAAHAVFRALGKALGVDETVFENGKEGLDIINKMADLMAVTLKTASSEDLIKPDPKAKA